MISGKLANISSSAAHCAMVAPSWKNGSGLYAKEYIDMVIGSPFINTIVGMTIIAQAKGKDQFYLSPADYYIRTVFFFLILHMSFDEDEEDIVTDLNEDHGTYRIG